ncbi:uncharacterized protein LOC135323547 isoform X2 [Dromaius novaehollandiae]|uniref:uncharacterized protein LOC112992404 isoform X2 n=1 Tax=Dromaius novaehollandiae TaxID=8790 RepID=UPI00311DD005
MSAHTWFHSHSGSRCPAMDPCPIRLGFYPKAAPRAPQLQQEPAARRGRQGRARPGSRGLPRQPGAVAAAARRAAPDAAHRFCLEQSVTKTEENGKLENKENTTLKKQVNRIKQILIEDWSLGVSTETVLCYWTDKNTDVCQQTAKRTSYSPASFPRPGSLDIQARKDNLTLSSHGVIKHVWHINFPAKKEIM